MYFSWETTVYHGTWQYMMVHVRTWTSTCWYVLVHVLTRLSTNSFCCPAGFEQATLPVGAVRKAESSGLTDSEGRYKNAYTKRFCMICYYPWRQAALTFACLAAGAGSAAALSLLLYRYSVFIYLCSLSPPPTASYNSTFTQALLSKQHVSCWTSNHAHLP